MLRITDMLLISITVNKKFGNVSSVRDKEEEIWSRMIKTNTLLLTLSNHFTFQVYSS
jgi:hypothetical protein